MNIETLQAQLQALEKELSKTRWIGARSRLALLRSSPDAFRNGLPPALLQAEEAAAVALSTSRKVYSHAEASHALSELEAMLGRYEGWD